MRTAFTNASVQLNEQFINCSFVNEYQYKKVVIACFGNVSLDWKFKLSSFLVKLGYDFMII